MFHISGKVLVGVACGLGGNWLVANGLKFQASAWEQQIASNGRPGWRRAFEVRCMNLVEDLGIFRMRKLSLAFNHVFKPAVCFVQGRIKTIHDRFSLHSNVAVNHLPVRTPWHEAG